MTVQHTSRWNNKWGPHPNVESQGSVARQRRERERERDESGDRAATWRTGGAFLIVMDMTCSLND